MTPTIYTSLDDPEFTRLFREFEFTAWRLETLQRYRVDYEQQGFAYFQEHGRLSHTAVASMNAWVDDVVAPAVSAGRRIGRVHVVENASTVPEQPVFTDYIRFEMKEYAISKAAGEDVRIITTSPGEWPADIWLPGHDFWLFDSSTLVEMHYEDDGRFKQAVRHTELTYPSALVRANRCRDAAMHKAKPFYP